jgi:N-acetylmuramic acid 6-phosphate (MurNAc-6-P) etherase
MNEEAALGRLQSAGGDLRIALVMSKTGCSRAEAERTLADMNGVVERAVENIVSASANRNLNL